MRSGSSDTRDFAPNNRKFIFSVQPEETISTSCFLFSASMVASLVLNFEFWYKPRYLKLAFYTIYPFSIMKVQEMSMNKDMVLEKHIFQMVIHMKGCMKMDRDTERLTINKINICQLKVSFSKSSISFSFKNKTLFLVFCKTKIS